MEAQQRAMVTDLPILIYYKFRGQLQPIRNLLCYINVPFIQIHPELFEEEKKWLPPAILQHIQRFKINKKQLPGLIHGEIYAEGQYVISDYICKRFNRIQLLGTNIYIRSRLQEILDIYFRKQPQMMIKLIEIADKGATISTETFNQSCKKIYQYSFNNSKYVREICHYLDRQDKPSYIFGEITLIDFFFLESCVYSTGIYGHPSRLDLQSLQKWDPSSAPLHKPNVYYITIIQQYQQWMTQQPWYLNNRKYLESFSVISPLLNAQRAEGFKKVWVGNPKLVA